MRVQDQRACGGNLRPAWWRPGEGCVPTGIVSCPAARYALDDGSLLRLPSQPELGANHESNRIGVASAPAGARRRSDRPPGPGAFYQVSVVPVVSSVAVPVKVRHLTDVLLCNLQQHLLCNRHYQCQQPGRDRPTPGHVSDSRLPGLVQPGLARKPDGYDDTDPPARATRAAHLADRRTGRSGRSPQPCAGDNPRLGCPRRPAGRGSAHQRTGNQCHKARGGRDCLACHHLHLRPFTR